MEDLIKRSDVIDAVIKAEIRASIYYKPNWDMVKKFIAAIPSADRPQGEWTNAGVLTAHCSNCKSEFHELEAMNFCPNCGARMKGSDDES